MCDAAPCKRTVHYACARVGEPLHAFRAPSAVARALTKMYGAIDFSQSQRFSPLAAFLYIALSSLSCCDDCCAALSLSPRSKTSWKWHDLSPRSVYAEERRAYRNIARHNAPHIFQLGSCRQLHTTLAIKGCTVQLSHEGAALLECTVRCGICKPTTGDP